MGNSPHRLAKAWLTDRSGAALHRQRSFVLLWGGQGVSEVGSQITTVALPLTAIYRLHAGAAQLGLLQTALWVPWLLFALPAGSWIDQRRRRPVLIAADAARAVLVAAIVVLCWARWISFAPLAVLVFVFGTMTVLFEVAYQSYLPSLVEPDRLVDANARLQATASVAQVGGPSLGGVLVDILSPPAALMADAISFSVSVTALIAIREPEPPVTPDQSGNSAAAMLSRVRDGLAFTYQNRALRALVGVAGTYNLFNQWVLTLFLLYAVRERGLSASAAGIVLGLGAVGAVIGAARAPAALRRWGLGPVLVGSVVVECIALALIPAASGPPAVTAVEMAALFGLNGLGVAASSVTAISLRQMVTPSELLGRMSASYRFVSYGAVSIGAALGGLAGQILGLRWGLVVASAGLTSTIASVLFSLIPRMRTLANAEVSPNAGG